MALKNQQDFDIWEGQDSRHRTPEPTWGFGQRAFNGDGLGRPVGAILWGLEAAVGCGVLC